MPATVRAFRERQPEVELRLEEGHSAELLADLNAGRIDVALVRRPVVDRRFVVDALADERRVAEHCRPTTPPPVRRRCGRRARPARAS